MSYSCKILLDSVSETGKRLTTFEITFPRIVLAEFNTHRMFSRNSASSRAIPFKKQIERVMNNPFIPERFPINSKGMQPQEYITTSSDKYISCSNEWIRARDECCRYATHLAEDLNIHKQIANRLLEPFQWHTVIVTATEFDNFFKLRTHPDAQYEIERIADLMYTAYHLCDSGYEEYQPRLLRVGEWHCPLIFEEDDQQIRSYLTNVLLKDLSYSPPDNQTNNIFLDLKKKISVARCARVSYLTQDEKRDIEKDLELFERLRESGHWSPFEHVASPYFSNIALKRSNNTSIINPKNYGIETDNDNPRWENHRSGNFIGWKQYRKEFQDENCTNFRKENN